MTNLRKVYESNLERKRVHGDKIASLEKAMRANSRIAVSNRSYERTLEQPRMKESQKYEKHPEIKDSIPCGLCGLQCHCQNPLKLGEEDTKLNEFRSQESDHSPKQFIERRIIENDPELVRLRMKRDAMIVQQVQIEQMSQVHRRMLEEKEYNKITDEEALARLGEEINRSTRDHTLLTKSFKDGRDALIRQMEDKSQNEKNLRDAEVMSDREIIRKHIKQEGHLESQRREYEIAKRIQAREDYHRFIEERRRKMDDEAKCEADQISLEIEYMRKVSEREEALARFKRMSEIERNRITSVITQSVDDAANKKSKHEELLNLLHMERIDFRDAQSIQKKERDKLNERLDLLEEYRIHKNHEHYRVLERKKESEETRNRESCEFMKYQTSQTDLRTQKQISQRALHDDLDSVLVEQRKEFMLEKDRQSRAATDRDLIRQLENELIEKEKAQIADDIRKLSVHM